MTLEELNCYSNIESFNEWARNPNDERTVALSEAVCKILSNKKQKSYFQPQNFDELLHQLSEFQKWYNIVPSNGVLTMQTLNGMLMVTNSKYELASPPSINTLSLQTFIDKMSEKVQPIITDILSFIENILDSGIGDITISKIKSLVCEFLESKLRGIGEIIDDIRRLLPLEKIEKAEFRILRLSQITKNKGKEANKAIESFLKSDASKTASRWSKRIAVIGWIYQFCVVLFYMYMALTCDECEEKQCEHDFGVATFAFLWSIAQAVIELIIVGLVITSLKVAWASVTAALVGAAVTIFVILIDVILVAICGKGINDLLGEETFHIIKGVEKGCRKAVNWTAEQINYIVENYLAEDIKNIEADFGGMLSKQYNAVKEAYNETVGDSYIDWAIKGNKEFYHWVKNNIKNF